MDLPPAGWYPEPGRPGLQRYWDGTAWTDHRAPLVADPTADDGRRRLGGIAVVVVLALIVGLASGIVVGRSTRERTDDGPGFVERVLGAPMRPGDIRERTLMGVSDRVGLQITRTQQVQVDVRSDTFDATVTLYDEDGNQLAFDDDGGSDRDARLEIELAPGTYELMVQRFAGERGTDPYEIEVT